MLPDTTASLLQSGNTLVAQAQAIATQDFSAARALWKQASVLFQRAHEADPEQHAAAFRLGQAWIAEAHALQKEVSEDAVAMWRQAALQCEVAFALDPHHAVTAMHVASCYAWAQDADAKQAWAQIAQHLQEEHAANMAADDACALASAEQAGRVAEIRGLRRALASAGST